MPELTCCCSLQYDQQGWKWTERPVDEKTAMRLERVLWPSALGWSIFAFAATCLQQNVREVQKHFGLQPSHQGSPSAPGGGATALSSAAKTEMQRTLHRLRQRTSRRPEEVQDPGALGSSQPVDGAGGASGPGANTAPTRPGNQARNAPGVARPGPKELFPGHAWIRSMIGPKPWEAFRMTLAQLWRPVVPHPPKGCVIVTGLVELETPRGWVIIDVLAGFDPTTRNYDGESLRLKVRRIQPRQQSPRR